MLVFLNGSVYKGQFLNGKMHGDGKLQFANGDEYEGTQIDKSTFLVSLKLSCF